jgi:hypothetical protein
MIPLKACRVSLIGQYRDGRVTVTLYHEQFEMRNLLPASVGRHDHSVNACHISYIRHIIYYFLLDGKRGLW